MELLKCRRNLIIALGAILLALYLIVTISSNPMTITVEAQDSPHQIYLPCILKSYPSAFAPTEDAELPGGSHTFTYVDIPAGVTVTVTGDVNIDSLDYVNIAGELIGDGTAITVEAAGDFTVTGGVNNHTTDDPDGAGDLTLYSLGGNLTIGTEDTPATLETSGDLDLSNDPSIEDWEFDVLPQHRADTKLPPVCAASSDTLWNTVAPTLPLEVGFFGTGADPDGGAVSYEWDFGDGGTSTEQDPLHTYEADGIHDVTLTVTDDDAQTCTATLRLVFDNGNETTPVEPALWIEPDLLVFEAGEEIGWGAAAEDPQDEDLTYSWDFGDSGISSAESPTHTYDLPGRYEVALTVTDTASNTTTANTSVYVYPATALAFGISPAQAVTPTVYVNGRIIATPTIPAPGRSGSNIRLRLRGSTTLRGQVIAPSGGSFNATRTVTSTSSSAKGFGKRGGRGGSLNIMAAGNLVISGGTYAAGDGGAGETVEVTAGAGQSAFARGGKGGSAAKRLRIAATDGITFQRGLFGDKVEIDSGSGGAGGAATATGGDGTDKCSRGDDGGSGTAIGGDGGRASKSLTVRGRVTGINNVQIVGSQGGDGGAANAQGGAGGDAICNGDARGGKGGWAYANGGRGGDARLSLARSVAQQVGADNDAFTGGEGGEGNATGGDGGKAVSTPANCGTANAEGGDVRERSYSIGTYNAFARGGRGGRGSMGRTDRNGNGGDADVQAGNGGDANAVGGDCTNCAAGGNATSESGAGGNAYGRPGRAGGTGATDGTAQSTGGDGGASSATGGAGGDC